MRLAHLETAAGPMLAAFTPRGLAALKRGEEIAPFAAVLERRFPGRAWGGDGADGADLAAQLDDYLAGTRRTFDVQLDLAGLSAFDQRVLRAVLEVPYGSTVTYGELAAQLGHPGAARAVGNALSRCPIGIVVPCHRVVRACDRLGGWDGNVAEKRRLLELERRARGLTGGTRALTGGTRS
jgi:methylated-DNA-[protein]-cysteine S-methyltransferase